MNTALSTELALTSDSLDSYLRQVRDIPMLDADEEYELAARLQKHDDLAAARRLILAHLRFVVHIARGYSGYGLPMHDLVQEGNIGLMKAVKRYNPDRKVRLVSFAVHWIRAEIHEYVIRNWRIVKVATTKAQRKLFFNLRGAKKRLGWLSREEVEAVAVDLGVPPETVVEMEARLSAQDVSFDAPDTDDEDGQYIPAPAAYLEDRRMDPAVQVERMQSAHDSLDRLHNALEGLDARSRDILASRWLAEEGEKATLHDLAARYEVSAERIRQLEKNALAKLKLAMEG